MKNKLISICVALVVVLLLVGLDQATKWAIVESIDLYERIEVIKGFFYLTYVQNFGASFSILEGIGVWFFAILTIVCLVVIVIEFIRHNDFRIQLSLALVFSGAVGNLIDRIMYGYVRDFLSFNLLGWDFPVFNVADICITVGFACLVGIMIFDDIQEKKRWKKLNSQ